MPALLTVALLFLLDGCDTHPVNATKETP